MDAWKQDSHRTELSPENDGNLSLFLKEGDANVKGDCTIPIARMLKRPSRELARCLSS